MDLATAMGVDPGLDEPLVDVAYAVFAHELSLFIPAAGSRRHPSDRQEMDSAGDSRLVVR